MRYIFLGLCIFVVGFGGRLFERSPSHPDWIMWMLLVSVGVLMPLGEPLAMRRHHSWMFESVMFTMTVVMLQALTREPGKDAAILAGVWFLMRLIVALETLWELRTKRSLDPGQLCIASARIFPAIGAAWLVAHRVNWTPFGFDPLIVLLTAAHFHHAGFTLPLIAGLNAKARPSCWTRFSCLAILIGVPLVAAGITCTHFGVLAFVEPFGVTVLVLGALGVAVSQMRLACQNELHTSHRLLHAVSGLSLLSAMFLALGFGLRHLLPWAALTMPQMWAIHGSLNTFGFGFCGLLGWRWMQHHRRSVAAGVSTPGLGT